MPTAAVGTAGWSYDDWKGIVYPDPANRNFDRLAFLTQIVDTVEVNSSFYRIPSPTATASWVARTAHLPHFSFSVKLYNGLTHRRNPAELHTLVSMFLDAIEPIHHADKLDAVLLQFPWSFRYAPDNLRWIETLVDGLANLPLAIEVRHCSWLNDDYIDWLTARNIAFCNIDQPQLNQCLPPTDICTAKLGYIRLHGRNSAKWFAKDTDAAERYDYLYSLAELHDWASRARTIAQSAQRVVMYANNHFAGQAVANALQLKSIILNRRIPVPVQLIRAFPQLTKIHDAAKPICNSPAGQSRRSVNQTGWLFGEPKP